MKQLLFSIICLLSFSFSAFAQTSETFDIATFQPPKGWEKQSSPDSVRFSIDDKSSGALCLITLLKSLPGPGNSKENFAAAWQLLVKGAVNVAAPGHLMHIFPAFRGARILWLDGKAFGKLG